jgi:hypothetical protein
MTCFCVLPVYQCCVARFSITITEKFIWFLGRQERQTPAGSDNPFYIAHSRALLATVRACGGVRERHCRKKPPLNSRWREMRVCNDNVCGESKSRNSHESRLDLTCLTAATDPKAPIYWYLISRQRLNKMLTFPLCCFDQIACWLPRNTP